MATNRVLTERDLTEKELRYIFELAHREWLDNPGHSRHQARPDQYLLARSYYKAVISFLFSRGYSIEMKNDKTQDKG